MKTHYRVDRNDTKGIIANMALDLSGPHCAECGGEPHTLGECPACHNTEESGKEMKRLNNLLRIAIHALDRIACDWAHIKRGDMVKISGEALCELGVWRKAEKGEFARNGVFYSTQQEK